MSREATNHERSSARGGDEQLVALTVIGGLVLAGVVALVRAHPVATTGVVTAAALTALRTRQRRLHDADGNRVVVREDAVDVSADFTAGELDQPGGRLAAEVGDAIAREALGASVADDYVYNATVIATIAVLCDEEREVFLRTWAGYDALEISRELGMTHQRVRTHLMAARKLVFTLIDHAEGAKLSDTDRRELELYLTGTLKGERRKHARRHMRHCTLCRRFADLYDHTARTAAGLWLPLPVLFAGAGAETLAGAAAVAGHTTATTTTPASAGTASAAATGTGASTAASAPGAGSVGWPGWMGLLQPVTAKVAVGLATTAVAATSAGVYQLASDRAANAVAEVAATSQFNRLPDPGAAVMARTSRPRARRPAPRQPAQHVVSPPRRPISVRRLRQVTRPIRTTSIATAASAQPDRPAIRREVRRPVSEFEWE